MDDSAFMQRRLADILHRAGDMQVIGCASNGVDVEHVREIRRLVALRPLALGGGNRELHCFKRDDGALLGILLPCATTNETERDSELQRLAGEFESSAE